MSASKLPPLAVSMAFYAIASCAFAQSPIQTPGNPTVITSTAPSQPAAHAPPTESTLLVPRAEDFITWSNGRKPIYRIAPVYSKNFAASMDSDHPEAALISEFADSPFGSERLARLMQVSLTAGREVAEAPWGSIVIPPAMRQEHLRNNKSTGYTLQLMTIGRRAMGKGALHDSHQITSGSAVMLTGVVPRSQANVDAGLKYRTYLMERRALVLRVLAPGQPAPRLDDTRAISGLTPVREKVTGRIMVCLSNAEVPMGFDALFFDANGVMVDHTSFDAGAIVVPVTRDHSRFETALKDDDFTLAPVPSQQQQYCTPYVAGATGQNLLAAVLVQKDWTKRTNLRNGSYVQFSER